ncbi:MAG: ATP-binding region, ATPase domain protein [Nocardioides sp.]|nr:ATP-binding region, ATPase domain protein [Nocardioides sp.]
MATGAQRAEPGRPVARLLAPVIWRMAVLVVIAVSVCIIGALLSESALRRVSDDVEPVSQAHDRVTDIVAELRTAAAGWAATGDPAAREAYREASAELSVATDELGVAALGTSTDPSVTVELKRISNWVRGFADPLVEAPPAPIDPARAAVGRDLIEQYREARDATRQALVKDLDRAEEATVVRLRLTIIAAVLVLIGSAVLISRSRNRLLAELSEPLLALERVVQKMLKNDPEGRAVAHRGPKEVRSIARALNDFADAGSRARAVEGRIQDELHVLDSAKDDFVSNVSHELRTPLTTISGYLEMVADEFEGQLQPRHERMLEATRRNVVRLRALIDDLLALSKAETRPSELEPSDVTQMVTDAVTDVRMTAARRGITVEVTAPSEPMPVVCDRAMLYRAFLNVLTNAVKFSHDGATVEVSVKRVLNRVEIAVRDHGIGIPRSELDRLGTRFFRASNAMTNEIAGTGLGLRIVQTIIDKHAGDVIIESAEGEGTTVYIRLRLHGERAGRVPVPEGVQPLRVAADADRGGPTRR